MMTIHAAKGLEFPFVYVVGMEEGLFPGSSAQFEEEELEEERRLCYVAMTRAKEHLTLTNARQRMLFGRTASNRLSRFLEEIPEENLQWEGRESGGSYGWGGSFGRQGFGGASGQAASPASAYGAAPRKPAPVRPGLRPSAPPPVQLEPGDRVSHTAFGQGTVASLQPMGGDALVQIDFETAGRKKLMLKAAAKHLKKL